MLRSRKFYEKDRSRLKKRKHAVLAAAGLVTMAAVNQLQQHTGTKKGRKTSDAKQK